MNKDDFFCGIDFGTSNSTCAVLDEDHIKLILLERANPTLPSAVFFPNKGKACFGKEAISSYMDGEEGRLLRGLKSVLGTALMSEKTLVGNKAITFEEILSIYIENIKNKAEAFLGGALKKVVMGRPVHFHDNNPEADNLSEGILLKILSNLGIKDVHFQYEPIAAAYTHEQSLQSEKIAVVIDLGGGTSDFTVIKLSPERALKQDRKDDILATAGIRVGGINFDKSLSMASFMPHLGLGSQFHADFDVTKLLPIPMDAYNNLSEWPLIHQAQSQKSIAKTKSLLRTSNDPQKLQRLLILQEEQLGHAFLQIVEQAKIELTDSNEYLADLNGLGLGFTACTKRNEFLNSIDPLLQKINNTLDECLSQAECKGSDIGLAILTGGSSELPVIEAMVKDKFPNAQISKDDKFGSVGRGLAYNASRI